MQYPDVLDCPACPEDVGFLALVSLCPSHIPLETTILPAKNNKHLDIGKSFKHGYGLFDKIKFMHIK